MLATNDPRAVDSLTAFGTDMDYVLEDGVLLVEYNVPLDLVASFIAANEGSAEGIYVSLEGR